MPHNMFVPNIIFDTVDCLLQFEIRYSAHAIFAVWNFKTFLFFLKRWLHIPSEQEQELKVKATSLLTETI